MNFNKLTDTIYKTQSQLQKQALQSVNQFLTIRNWLIGLYITEYEQQGNDRAKYGENLMDDLAIALKKKKLKGFSSTNLKLCRQFYFSYPLIGQEFFSQKQLQGILFPFPISQTLSDQFKRKTAARKKSQTLSDQSFQTKKSKNKNSYYIPSEILLQHFSFSHFIELMQIEDPLKRTFYEVESLKGCWSVRQLKRQIESLLFERTGLSGNYKTLLKKIIEIN